MTQSCIISTTPFASAIQACGRACSQPLAFYVTCVCFLLVAVCYVVHERAARKVAEYEVEAAEPIVVFFICLQIKCVFLRGVARSSGARVSGVSNDWRARSRCVRAEGRVM